MENINEEHFNLIAKHLRGDTSGDEEIILKEWLNEDSQHKVAYEELKFLWNAERMPDDHVPDVAKAWEKVKVKAQISGKVRPLYDVKIYMKVAAVLVMMVGIGYMMKTIWLDKETITQLSSGDEKKEFYLPDSSKVWLNKNTKLFYSDKYNKSERVVELEGEAFFEVKKDKEKPFIVNGRLSRTQVLGTSFNVRSLKGEASDKIEVVTGKVSFSSRIHEAKVFLLAGDGAALKEGGEIEKVKTDNSNSLAWKSEKLIFDNTSLQTVAFEMQNYFNVPVIIQDSELYNCRFTGTFNKPTIEEVMKVLSASINLSYNRKDNVYVLTGKGCELKNY
jgi:transmembrane sensor